MGVAEVQALLDRGRFLAAIRLADELAESPAAQLLAVRGLLYLGRWREGRTRALAVLETGNAAERAAAHYYAGIATLELGDPYAAEEHLLAALAGDLPAAHTASARYNLARAYSRLGRPDLAVSMYRSAIAGFAGRGDAWHEVSARQNLAWVLLCQGQTGGARAELDACLGRLRSGSPEQAHQLALEALVCARQGQTAEAARLCEELLAPGHPAAGAWDRAFAAWLAADLALAEGRDQLARAFLAEAERHAAGARDPHLWNRIGDLRRRLAEAG